jgi:hypothetical protein
MTTPDTPAGRGISALTAALADLAADAVEGCTLERVILYGTYTDGRSGYAGTARRTIAPDELRAVLREPLQWQAAFEALHARVHRDFNFDASESAAPDDEYWARLMDDLVIYADEVHPEIETGTVPSGTDNERQ